MAAEIHLPFVLGESGDGGAGTYTAYILDVSRNKRLDAVLDDIEQNAHSYTGGDGVNVSSGYVISLTTATASKIGGVKLGATASDTNRPVLVDSNGNAQVAMQEADATHKGVARLTTTATASADAQSDATAITPKAVAAMITSAGGNYVAGTGIDITNGTISVTAAYAGKIDKIGDVSGYGANETIAGKIATLEGINYTGGDGVNVSSGYVISLTTATASKIGGVKLGATASDTNRPVSVDSNGNAQVAMQEADATHKGVARLTTTATASADAQSDATAITPKAVAAMITSAGGNYVAGTGIDITNGTISVTAAYVGKIDKIGDVSSYGANETIVGKIATLEGINYTGGDGVNVSSGYVISLTTATASKIGGVKLGATASDTNRPVSVDSNGNAQVSMQEADATHKGVARLTTTATASADAQSDATAITPKAVAAMISSAGGNYVAGTGIDITNDTISITTAYVGKIDKIGDVSGYGANETIAGKIATLEGITYTGGDGVNVSSGYVISLTTATASKIGGVKLGATASDTNRPVSVDSNGNAQVAMQEADATHKGVAQLSTGATILSDAQSDAKAVTPNALATFFGSRIWIGTQAQYDAIVTKDANMLYFIKES